MKLKEVFSDDERLPWKKGDMVTFQVKPGSDKFDHGRILHIKNSRGQDFYNALSKGRADGESGEIGEGIFDRFKRKKKYQGIEVAVRSARTGKPVFIDASQIVSKV